MDVGQRFIFLKELQLKPAATLMRFFDFPSTQDIATHQRITQDKSANLCFPWIPLHRTPTLLIATSEYPAGMDLGQSTLDQVHVSVNTVVVKAQWPLLKSRLQKSTQIAGSKTKLAKFLGVKLASVSQWLTDSESAREPGAETTLRMLRWVEQQERKT